MTTTTTTPLFPKYKVSAQDVDVSLLSGYFANPPDRTDPENPDFKKLVAFIEAGGVIPAIAAVFERTTGRFLISAGHRRSAASKAAGKTKVRADVYYVEPGQGVSADEFRVMLYKQFHVSKKFAGKEHFYVAVKTNGNNVSPGVKDAWNLVERHYGRDMAEVDRQFLLGKKGGAELMRIANQVTMWTNNHYTAQGTPMTAQRFSLFFRKVARWAAGKNDEKGCQRDLRDYVAKQILLGRTNARLIRAIEKNTSFAF